jgi:hypothetical protein
MITKQEEKKIELIQNQINKVVENNTYDSKSLLLIAGVLFSSALKCYRLVLGDEGTLDLLHKSVKTVEGKVKKADDIPIH